MWWTFEIKEQNTLIPSTLFAQSHSKEDAQSGKVFVDDRSKALREKYEAFRVQRGLKEGTHEAERYYEVSGVWSSTYTPSEYSKLKCELKSTLQQLNEQRRFVQYPQKTMENQQKIVEDQQCQFEQVMRLIHSLQSRVNLLSGSSSSPSD